MINISSSKKKKILSIYRSFENRYHLRMNEQWKLWCARRKTVQEREEIALGAILTQRTRWSNVEKALLELKTKQKLSLRGVLDLFVKNKKELERIVRPCGFLKQKIPRVVNFCAFVIGEYGSLKKFSKIEALRARQELLSLEGVGPETADSILLYSLDKPIFVIDEYTRRLVREYKLSDNLSYQALQNLFEKSLPKDVNLFQDFHALIVLAGQDNSQTKVKKS